MSIAAFLDAIKTDPALHKFVEEIGLLQETDEAIGRLVSVGVENGFNFTVKELQDEVVRRAAELSDEQLEGIAGGVHLHAFDPKTTFCFTGPADSRPTPNQIIGILVAL